MEDAHKGYFLTSLASEIAELTPHLEQKGIFICGTPVMIQTLRRQAHQAGVAERGSNRAVRPRLI